jgi:hypothetical protein
VPQIEGAGGPFMLEQMALLAELHAGFISDRTKAALAPPSPADVRPEGWLRAV